MDGSVTKNIFSFSLSVIFQLFLFFFFCVHLKLATHTQFVSIYLYMVVDDIPCSYRAYARTTYLYIVATENKKQKKHRSETKQQTFQCAHNSPYKIKIIYAFIYLKQKALNKK